MIAVLTLPSGAPALAPERPAPPAPLAERIAASDFAALYERVAPRLWKYVRGHVGDAAEADDLTQEAFTRVFASRFEPESEEHLTRYLFKTAIHLVRDRGRAGKRTPLALDEIPEPARREAPPALGLELERALRTLKPRERQLLYLAHVAELDHRAIAETIDAQAGSVRVMLFRARRKLAAAMGAQTRKSGGGR